MSGLQQSRAFYQEILHCYGAGYHRYLIVDTSRNRQWYQQMATLNPPGVSLFKEQSPSSLQSVAPYLVAIDTLSDAHLLWLDTVLDSRSGLFLLSRYDFATLYQHVRHLNLVKKYDGKKMYFRYFDAFHLNVWLNSGQSQQHHYFFGPIAMIFGHKEKNTLHQWYLDDQNQLNNLSYTLGQKLTKVAAPYLNRSTWSRQYNQLLTVDKHQLQAIDGAIEKQQFNTIYQYLMSQHPSLLKLRSEREIILHIYHVMMRGRSCYHLYDTQSLAWLVKNSFQYAPYFDTQPSIHGILMQTHLSSQRRLHTIKDTLDEHHWHQASALTQPYQ